MLFWLSLRLQKKISTMASTRLPVLNNQGYRKPCFLSCALEDHFSRKSVLVLIGLEMKNSGSSINQVPSFCLSTVALRIYKATLILHETLLTQSCQSTGIAGSEEITRD